MQWSHVEYHIHNASVVLSRSVIVSPSPSHKSLMLISACRRLPTAQNSIRYPPLPFSLTSAKGISHRWHSGSFKTLIAVILCGDQSAPSFICSYFILMHLIMLLRSIHTWNFVYGVDGESMEGKVAYSGDNMEKLKCTRSSRDLERAAAKEWSWRRRTNVSSQHCDEPYVIYICALLKLQREPHPKLKWF